MLTIIGTGMNEYSLKEVINKTKNHDYIALDKNYIENNKELLKDKKIITGGFREVKEQIRDLLNKNINTSIAYFVSGSPVFYSGGISLIQYLEKEIQHFNKNKDVQIIPNTSSKDAILAKLAINSKEVNPISCHSSSSIDLNYFFTKRYTTVIAKENTLEDIQELLKHLSTKDYKIIIGSKLGYDNERIFEVKDKNIDTADLMPYTLIIEKLFVEKEKTSFNEEDFYQDKGMITKEDKRLLLLSYLELKPNILLWDIGAGTGSIGITAHKIHRVYTIFFEKNTKRVEDIKKNLSKFKVIGTNVIEGDAIQNAEKEYIRPDRIVIGGGGESVSQNIDILYNKLKPGGILVAIFVSLKSLMKAIDTLKKNNMTFETKAISYTIYNDNSLIAKPQRLSFIIKAKRVASHR